MEQILRTGDLWRLRMQRSAEHLRRLDERLFEEQIARIHECLRRDAEWNLESALRACDRWYGAQGRAG